jgi:antitoxin MazE
MKTTITKIGNSKGVIIPVPLLKQCGFGKEVSLQVKNETLVISKVGKPREGWEQAFANAGADEAMVDDFGNDFDRDEWVW